jgi:hypothetical protein
LGSREAAKARSPFLHFGRRPIQSPRCIRKARERLKRFALFVPSRLRVKQAFLVRQKRRGLKPARSASTYSVPGSDSQEVGPLADRMPRERSTRFVARRRAETSIGIVSLELVSTLDGRRRSDISQRVLHKHLGCEVRSQLRRLPSRRRRSGSRLPPRRPSHLLATQALCGQLLNQALPQLP